MGFFSYLYALMSRCTPDPDCLIFETIGPEPEHFDYCDIEVVGSPNGVAQYTISNAKLRPDSAVGTQMTLPNSSSAVAHSNISDLSVDSYYSTTSILDSTEPMDESNIKPDASPHGIDIRDFAYPSNSGLHAPAVEQADSGRFRWVKMYKKGASWKRWMNERMIDEFKKMGYGVVYIGADADEEEKRARRKKRLEGFKEAMMTM